jgi:cytoskeletal protein CcmA (bactofilin family)
MFDMNQIRNVAKRHRGGEDTAVEENDRPAGVGSKLTRTPASTSAATIGSSIVIRGDLEGKEDLVIEGKVEGTIKLAEHNLTIGENGDINADVHARTITVKGNLEGDLYGADKVIIRQSGNVHGNIFAPSVNIEDGARYRGSIDMEAARKDENRNNVVEAAGIKPGKSSAKPATDEARQA